MALILAPGVWAAGGKSDPAFEKIPFEQWMNERDTMRLRWRLEAGKPAMSFHQRLSSAVTITIDGRELWERRGEGQLVLFIEAQAADGGRYQCHGSIALSKIQDDMRSANLEYQQHLFVLPGDYQISVAILDTRNSEHAARRMTFRVARPALPQLAEWWSRLPAVEFIEAKESPESWYLPDVNQVVRWASQASGGRLNVIFNVPGPAPTAPHGLFRREDPMQGLLPAFKSFTRPTAEAISTHVEMIDLSRHKTVLHVDGGAAPDWEKVKAAYTQARSNAIDVKVMAERHQDAHYFVKRVRAMLAASEEPSVLVVLSPAVVFESGENLEPISPGELPRCRVFYLRYDPLLRMRVMAHETLGGQRMGGRRRPPDASWPLLAPTDQLADLLKPIGAKIVDVDRPERMAQAMAEVEKALAGGAEK